MTRLQARVFQNRAPDGEYVSEERLEEIVVGGMQPSAGQILKVIREYSPTLTDSPGVYAYDDLANGAGWLRVEGAGALTLSRLEDLVRLLEVERALGETDPVPGVEVGIAAPLAFHNRSPVVQVLTGAGFVALGGYIATWFGTGRLDSAPKLLFSAALAILLVGGGIGVIVMGLRRLRWWVRARRWARSDGGHMPDDLRIWG